MHIQGENMGFAKEFKEFLTEYKVIGLAIAFIMGAILMKLGLAPTTMASLEEAIDIKAWSLSRVSSRACLHAYEPCRQVATPRRVSCQLRPSIGAGPVTQVYSTLTCHYSVGSSLPVERQSTLAIR